MIMMVLITKSDYVSPNLFVKNVRFSCIVAVSYA